VPERQDPCVRETCTRVHAGVGKRVDQDQIARARKRAGQTDIGEIAAAEDERRSLSLAVRQARLELVQQRMAAGDKPRSTGANPVARDRCGGRSLDPGIMREAEVIVARKRYEAATVAHDLGCADAVGRYQLAPQRLRLKRRELGPCKFIQAVHHFIR